MTCPTKDMDQPKKENHDLPNIGIQVKRQVRIPSCLCWFDKAFVVLIPSCLQFNG